MGDIGGKTLYIMGNVVMTGTQGDSFMPQNFGLSQHRTSI